ncbi:MAG TPA: hypothetical protein VIK78_10200 [Ruminiclostridium sp.]
MSKKNTYKKLESYLLNEYNKADTGIIREIFNKGSVEEAIKNADRLYQLIIDSNMKVLFLEEVSRNESISY